MTSSTSGVRVTRSVKFQIPIGSGWLLLILDCNPRSNFSTFLTLSGIKKLAKHESATKVVA